MGNESLEGLKNKCDMIIQPPHEMLNNTKIIRKEGKPVLLSQWPFFSKQMFRLWERQYLNFINTLFGVQNLSNSRQPLLQHFLLPFSYQYSHVNVCSSTGIVTMSYQLPGKSLATDIQERSLRNEPYQEHQIWILIYQLTKVVSFLQEKQVNATDIRSQNVLVDFIKKNIKIITEVSWIEEPTFIQKIAKNYNIFIAPEILRQKQLKQQLKRSFFKSNDNFSVGMTLCQCILLEDLSKIYEFESNQRRMNHKKYLELLNKIVQIKYYSWKLLMIVVGLIQLDLKERISCDEVCQLLKHSKKQIMACEQFQIRKEQFLQQIPQKYKLLEKFIEEIDYKIQNKNIIGSRISLLANRDLKYQDSGYTTINNSHHLRKKSNYSRTSNNSQLPLMQSSVVPYIQHQQNNSQNHYFSSKPQYVKQFNHGQQRNFVEERKISFAKDSHISFQYSNTNPQEKYPQSTGFKSNKLDQIWAVSAAKDDQNMRIHEDIYTQSPRFKGDDQTINLNCMKFPVVKLFSDNIQQKSPGKNTIIECQSAIQKLEDCSVSKSTETLLLMPSVYNVSNPPDSYISYHYTKSISPNQRKVQINDREECLSFDTKVFNLQNDIPETLGPRKKSEQVCRTSQKCIPLKQYAQFKRRTIGFSEPSKYQQMKK